MPPVHAGVALAPAPSQGLYAGVALPSPGATFMWPSYSMLVMGLPLPKAYWLPVNGSVVRPVLARAPLYMSREVNWFRPGA